MKVRVNLGTNFRANLKTILRAKWRRKAKAGKKAAVYIGIMTTLLISGCSDGVRTEEEIVTPKQEETGGAEEAGASGGQENGTEPQGAEAEGIAEQVDAPETYVWDGNSEDISVKVNAPVIVPEGEGFKTYRVSARTYTQEDYDRISQVLLKGAELWERDYEQMEKSHGFTKAEVEERIARFEAYKEAGGQYEDSGKEVNYDQLIEEWKTMKENAPDEVITKDIPATVSYNENVNDPEENGFSGYATVDGQNYFVSVDNNLQDDWRWITFEIRAERTNANFMPVYGETEAYGDPDKLPAGALKEDADKLIADMGFSDFKAAGDEYLQTYVWDEELNALSEEKQEIGYGIHFTRILDGIPVTYTYSTGTAIEDGAVSAWPYETLDMIYGGEGIVDFKWMNPYNVEKLSDETVFLIPFSDIQSIFEEMFLKKYADLFEQSGAEVSFEIDQVRLGYMRVMEKGNVMEGTMIPVWDFFGNQTITYEGDSESYSYGGAYASWFTINALDGTIINRDLGY